MGIIINQSIRSTFSYYTGMIIGAINTIILYPIIFSNNPEYLGLIQILLSYSLIFSVFSSLSIPAIFIKYFPQSKYKAQLFFFSSLMFVIGFIIFIISFNFFFNNLIINTITDTYLLKKYSYFIIPIVFFISLSDILSAFSRSYLDSSTPIFLNEVFLKIYSVFSLLLYWKGYINFDLFLKVYFVGYLLRLLILFALQLNHKRLYIQFNISKLNIKEMLEFGLFVLLGGTSALLISKIDMLMLASYVNLENVAYYTIAFYIGNAIIIPARSIDSISAPLIAEAWKENNLELIKDIYYKSSINQLILGGVFFLCIWANIDSIMSILHSLSPKFSGGKYVVLFIALARITQLISGVNSSIIINSKYYKFDLFSNFPFLIFIVASNHILIPSNLEVFDISLSGINGAACATFISSFLYYMVKIIFVYVKFKIHPFSANTIKIILVLLIIYFIINNMNLNFNMYANIICNSAIILFVFTIVIYMMRVSEEINNLLLLIMQKINHFLFRN